MPPGGKHALFSRGFTLLDLAVVLVIVGLITGGALIGNDLLRSAQVLSLGTDATMFISGVDQFKQRYHYLPGDLPNATDIWGANPNCATYGLGTGIQTCNGNGDGMIFDYADSWMTGGPDVGEMFYVWQHLTNAGLIPGKYTGLSGTPGPNNVLPGINVPASKLAGAGYALVFFGTVYSGTYEFTGIYQHVYFFGTNIFSGMPVNPALTAAEAYQVDKKFDDGLPATGTIS